MMEVYLIAVDDERSKVVFHAWLAEDAEGIAREAGVHDILWHPEGRRIACAIDLVGHLERGIIELEAVADHGRLAGEFLGWLGRYRDACVRHRDAIIVVCRAMEPAGRVVVGRAR